MGKDQKILDDLSTDQMVLNNPLKRRRIALAIPRAFGVDDSNRTTLADTEAIRLRAKNAALVGKAKLAEAPLQELPRSNAAIHVAALWFRLLGAQEDVATRDGDANSGCDLEKWISHEMRITAFPAPDYAAALTPVPSTA
jgi:hypothetical protein